MRILFGRVGVRALLALAVLGAACSDSDQADGRYSSLLSLVPDQPSFREGVRIVDYEAIRALPGYEASRALGVTDEELAADPEAISQALGWHQVALPLREILGFNWHEDLPVALPNLEQGFGIGLGDIDLALTAGVRPPRTLHAVGGNFDPDAVARQLEGCTECEPAERLEYAGQEYLSWGDGQRLSIRMSPPGIDAIGRGGHWVFDESYIIRSNFIEEFEASIDAAEGDTSLLNDEHFALLAATLDSLDLLALFLSDQTPGPEQAALMIEQARTNETLADRVLAAWDVPDEQKLGPYEAFAVGLGVEDDEFFVVVLLAHQSDEAAAANVQRFRDRLATGVTASDGRIWAETVSSFEVTANGRLLTATLRGTSGFSALVGGPALASFEALLLHE